MIGQAASAALGEVAGTVIPQADVVKLLDTESCLCRGSGIVENPIGEGVGWQIDLRGADGEVGGVGSEEVEVVEAGLVLVGASESDYNEADQRGDGEGHGCEDTGQTARFAHDDGRCLGSRGVWSSMALTKVTDVEVQSVEVVE